MSKPAFEIVCVRGTSETDWLIARELGIGASESADLMGCGWNDEKSLEMRKLNLSPPVEVNDNMLRGKRLQAPIIERYNAEHAAHAIEWEELLRSTETPCMMATPDARDGDVLIEIKAPKKTSKRYWKEGVPDSIANQVQHQLYVTGLETAVVVALFCPPDMDESAIVDGKVDMLALTVERDEWYISMLREACEKFWTTLTITKTKMNRR
jgi:putative phage-type endonuclease